MAKSSTSFEKGKSGNPGGRPKRNAEVAAKARDLIKQYRLWEGIAQTAATAEKDSDRIAATKEIFNRAYGQAPQTVEFEGDNIPGFVFVPPPEEREEWEKRVQEKFMSGK